MLKGFRDFIARGNLVELAVAFVMGLAFASVIQALVRDLITPIIAAIAGKPSFGNLSFTINNSRFLYGNFINALLNFLIVALAIYFFVIVPYNRFTQLRNRGQAPTERDCPYCLSAIPIKATRCPQCTSEVQPAPAAS